MSSSPEKSWEGVRPASVARHEMVVEMNAPRARVWAALTAQIHGWWLPDFHMAHPRSKMVFELTPGGRVYEEGPGGENLLWFRVMAVTPGESVHLEGAVMPPWGGPAVIHAWLQLQEAGPSRTTLRFSECLIGQVDDGMIRSMAEGWEALFGQGLKGFVEA